MAAVPVVVAGAVAVVVVVVVGACEIAEESCWTCMKHTKVLDYGEEDVFGAKETKYRYVLEIVIIAIIAVGCHRDTHPRSVSGR